MGNIIQNTAEMRSFNRKKIIEYLRYNNETTKKELSDSLELSFATVSNLCNELIKDDLLDIVSSFNSSGGRIPGLISIKPLAKVTLCINLSKNNEANIALINLKNDIIVEKRISTAGIFTSEEIVQEVYNHSIIMLNDCKIDSKVVLGIGVAAPGIFYKENRCIVNSTNQIYENQPLKDMFERIFGLPTYIENESNLLAIAAALYDPKGLKSKDLIYIFIGEGLGTGIITNGSLVTGNRGLGGEISHIPIGSHGFQCYCGNKGCIETELTIDGFLKKYYGQEFHKSNYGFEPWENFITKVKMGDTKAMDVIEESGKLFGELISILINIFDPKIVFLGGKIESIFDYLYPSMIQEAKSRVMVNQVSDFTICNSINYESLIFQGCCEIIINQWRP